MTVLVTGGCGYIGAHVVHALHQAGEKVVVVDDLSYGKPTRIEGSRLYGMDIAAPAITTFCPSARSILLLSYTAS